MPGQPPRATGVVLLALRYRRSSAGPRRRIRWLLLPALLAAGVAVLDLVVWRLYPDGVPSAAAEAVMGVLWIPVIASLPLAVAVALLRPTLLDVDWLIRKSLVYGLLWAVIATVYVGAAAGLGLAAGRRLPLGLAIAIAVGATVVFQPARHRLERVADRWVFRRARRPVPARRPPRVGARGHRRAREPAAAHGRHPAGGSRPALGPGAAGPRHAGGR